MKFKSMIAALALSVSAAAHEYQSPRTVFLGDSITVRLQSAPGWTHHEVFIAAGGQYVLGTAAVALPAAVGYLYGPAMNRPQVGTIVLWLGTGDYYRQNPVAGFQRRLAQLVTGLAGYGRVVCVLPLPRADEYRSISLDRYRAAVQNTCPGWIDPREAIPAYDPALYEDQVHPNSAGAVVLAEWIRNKVGVPIP